MTSSPRARPSNWVNSVLYSYMIVAVSLHKTHIRVVKSLVKIAAVSWHSLRRFIKPAPGAGCAQTTPAVPWTRAATACGQGCATFPRGSREGREERTTQRAVCSETMKTSDFQI